MLPYYSQSWMMYHHQQYYQQQQQQQQQQQTTSNQYQNPWYSSNYQQQQQQQQQTDLLPSLSALSSTSQAYYPQQQQEQQQYWGQFQQFNNYYSPSATPYQYSNNYEQCENNETPSTSITSGPLSGNSTSTIESETTNKRPPYKWLESSPIEEKPGRTRTKEKYRAVYTDFQRIELEKEFHCQSRYITVQRKLELSKFLGLSERQIKIWFQNRRAKERRQAQRQTPNRHPNRELPSTSINQENCYNFRRSNNSTITTNSVDFDSTQNLQSEQNHTIVTESPNTFSNFYQNQISDIGTNRNHSSNNYNRNNIKNEQEFDDNSMLDFEFVDVQETN